MLAITSVRALFEILYSTIIIFIIKKNLLLKYVR